MLCVLVEALVKEDILVIMKLVKIGVYLQKRGRCYVDPLTNDPNHSLSPTCIHPIIKAVNTNLC